ncbi:GNAT family N-acetyltransferase [Rhodoligotrophos defluvii]|uniref:GNAT family N-acetyltransferase n=1 Tax=Rhodoligotrophos defluvii TaxID=2561934 RepID=UPI0010C9D2D4|nr:GNAT family N-acetyltransferase [Rhodoligotrophos defluvii]
MTIAVADHRRDAELPGLVAEWRALWERVPTATPFQHPDWLVTWWEVFAPGDLFVVTARWGDRLVGMAPLYREVGPLGKRLLPLGISVSDYLDLLVDPACAEAGSSALVSHILRSDLSWHEWELPELLSGAAGLSLARPSGMQDETVAQSICPVLSLPASVEALAKVIPPRKRRKLRMARNRARRRGPVAIERIGSEDTDDAFAALLEFHRARWHHHGETAVLANARAREFHRMAMRRLNEAGIARIYRLSITGATAGIYYGFLRGRHAYAYLGGFNPDFAFESPGTLLIGHAIEQAVRDGAERFHFLRGDEPYKFEWGAAEQWTQRRVFRRVDAHVHA